MNSRDYSNIEKECSLTIFGRGNTKLILRTLNFHPTLRDAKQPWLPARFQTPSNP